MSFYFTKIAKLSNKISIFGNGAKECLKAISLFCKILVFRKFLKLYKYNVACPSSGCEVQFMMGLNDGEETMEASSSVHGGDCGGVDWCGMRSAGSRRDA